MALFDFQCNFGCFSLAHELLIGKFMIRNILIAIYIFVILGISATVRAEQGMQAFLGNDKQAVTTTHAGQLLMTLEGKTYLVVSEDKFFELKSNVDLAGYNGLQVLIEGIELKYKVLMQIKCFIYQMIVKPRSIIIWVELYEGLPKNKF